MESTLTYDPRIEVSIRPQRPLLLSGIPNNLFVMFEITTGKSKGEENRPPMDLVVVLDRSGSMSGDKIRFAKEATKEIIDRLKPSDYLSLVVYDDNVDIVFAGPIVEDKTVLHAFVDKVTPGGSTNLSGGLMSGFDVLSKIEKKNKLQRIFLFSDGRANVGVQNHSGVFSIVDKFVKSGVTVSSFGLGDDYDEDMMRGIAERGSGDYYFIDSAQDITKFVSKAVEGLLGLIGTNARFNLRGHDGVTVKKIFGPENPSDGYSFGDITTDNFRNILTDLEVVPTDSSKIWSVFTWELTYTPIKDDAAECVKKGEFEMHCTNDFTTTIQDDLEVIVAVKIKEVGSKDREIKKLIDQNQIDLAITRKKEMLCELEEFEKNDKSGRITKLIDLAKKALQSLENPAPQQTIIGSPSRYGGQLKSRTPKINLARKCFDSADYMCRNDNKFNWDNTN